MRTTIHVRVVRFQKPLSAIFSFLFVSRAASRRSRRGSGRMYFLTEQGGSTFSLNASSIQFECFFFFFRPSLFRRAVESHRTVLCSHFCVHHYDQLGVAGSHGALISSLHGERRAHSKLQDRVHRAAQERGAETPLSPRLTRLREQCLSGNNHHWLCGGRTDARL